MSLLRRRFLSLAPATVLASCASPPAQYYRLAAMPGAVLNTAPQSLRIRNISIPGYLAQSNIARPSSAYQFATFANALWADSLASMLQSTLLQNLTQRLPRMTVTSSNGAVGATADLLAEVNILRFDPDPSGSIVLIAQLAIKTSSGDFVSTKTTTSSATPATSDAAGTAATMSTLWARLADIVAQSVSK